MKMAGAERVKEGETEQFLAEPYLFESDYTQV